MAGQNNLELHDGNGYENQRKYLAKVSPVAELRQKEIEADLRAAFREHFQERPVEVIVFEKMAPDELAEAIRAFPSVLKPLLEVLPVCPASGSGF